MQHSSLITSKSICVIGLISSAKSRIKRLCGIQDSDYRLRVGDYRIFYNIDELNRAVQVLRIIHKQEARKFYEEEQK